LLAINGETFFFSSSFLEKKKTKFLRIRLFVF